MCVVGGGGGGGGVFALWCETDTIGGYAAYRM